jgi:hypothetical protein
MPNHLRVWFFDRQIVACDDDIKVISESKGRHHAFHKPPRFIGDHAELFASGS